MLQTEPLHQIRAAWDETTVTVFQAFSPSIAEPALQAQKLVPPFSYSRFTWIKPSVLWLMYRSDWARSAGQERILEIRIHRDRWEDALRQAVLTSPSKRVYPDAKDWRKQLRSAPVRVQWDPERDLRKQRLDHRSIQVGIGPKLSEEYAKKWIVSIQDWTPKARQLERLVADGRLEEAQKLLPAEKVYPVDEAIRAALGVD